MNWFFLIIAGLFEVAFTFCLGKAKQSAGTEMYLWYAGFLFSLIISMLLLIKASQTIPLGTAYAVWTGIGAVGTIVIGVLLLHEPANFWRLFFCFLLVGSVVGLKYASH